MGIYLNPNNVDFYNSVNHSQIYVDKTELIKYTNSVLYGQQRFVCVIRPRRFGKSMAADMLTAYYSKGCDSRELFSNLKISKSDNFEKHLNKYNVIRINMLTFFEEADNVSQMIKFIEEDLNEELMNEYPNVRYSKRPNLIKNLSTVFSQTNIPFVIIIDEWDCVLRDKKNSEQEKKQYLDFLCALFKGQSYIALAYMTGILPIKKCGGQSEINSFYEYTMIDASPITEFTGFTENEVNELCNNHNMPFDEMKRWYNGYNVEGMAIYNPKSVVESILRKKLSNYWTLTETYKALKYYIEMNFDGLKDTIVELLAGGKAVVDTTTFSNDMNDIETKDDVLTVLIHLGYLTYDFQTKEVSIPNYEISEQFASTIKASGWSEVAKSLKQSEELLKATLNCKEEKVAEMIEETHRNNVSILKYNDENSLSCVISLAYYSARKNYSIYREMPSGEGYADLVFIPRKNCPDPAMIVELKYMESAKTAIQQIKDKKYVECLQDYSGEILLVGISYDKDAKENKKHHICKIEKIFK